MKRANLSMKRAVLFLSLALLLCCLTGCAPMRGSGKSYSAALPEAAAERIALDAAARLALLYPPGHTALYLHRPEPEKPGAKPALFDRLFENHLRAKGFRIVPEAAQAGPQVSWTVDSLGSVEPTTAASWYLRLSVADKDGLRFFSRVYDEQGQAQGGFAEGVVE